MPRPASLATLVVGGLTERCTIRLDGPRRRPFRPCGRNWKGDFARFLRWGRTVARCGSPAGLLHREAEYAKPVLTPCLVYDKLSLAGVLAACGLRSYPSNLSG
jgi:hypothetical protein